MTSKLDRQRAQEIDEILRKIEPKFKKAFKVGLESIRDIVSLSEIERAINSGNLDRAAGLINELIVATSFIQFNQEIQNAVQAGGNIAASWAAAEPRKASRLVFALNVTESNTARFINQYQAQKVREVAVEIQRNIGEIIRDAVNQGENPRGVARRVRSSIGLTLRQQQAVENFERLLRDGKKESLTRALRDKRFDRTIIRAIDEQRELSPSQIRRMVDRYRERYINYRAETIARTEAIRLVSLGQKEFWRQAVEDGLVSQERLKRKWIPTLDAKLRESHAAIPRMNPDGVGLDEPFKSPEGPIRFPGDPLQSASMTANCRCAVYTRIEAE